MPVSWQIAPSLSTARSMFCAMIVSACAARVCGAADLIAATILSKKAAAEANASLGRLDPPIAAAIVTAADEILGGALRDQFVVDIYQAGAGTSHNMNANEVLANRAGEILGDAKG